MIKQQWLIPVALATCMTTGQALAKTELHLQRFFGACEAEYGENTNVDAAEGECGIMTSLINKFAAENPDIDVKVTTVEWPGYDQLTAQMASRTPPDLVTMHNSVIADYQSRRLILPINDLLQQGNIDTADFTSTALNGVVRDGEVFGLPMDTWTMLYHVNTNLMAQAGLMKADGTPMLPGSSAEMLQMARQFKDKTGKPYLIQILSNETAAYTRMFYTYLFQQEENFFADPNKISLQTDAARTIVNHFKTIYDEGLTTKNMDYPATVSAFSGGEGGILMNGNWLLGAYTAESKKTDSQLYNAYQAYPYPQLFANDDLFVDGHSWVMPNKKRNKKELAATAAFFKFMAENDYQWSRTGHLPSMKAVLDNPDFKALPHRSSLMSVTTRGKGLPGGVKRQFAVQDIIGEELASAITGVKSVDAALKDAEDRVNDLLGNL
ncbi:ABC transporter substrate-binding protein [Reinekea sp. G2M2-21]|uniref:ABC transporter substrate-binding protein n=1 Tax=Reinekea sp. G2M2-21 TaxID=2788942 RepID=UPI0018AB9405|nr:extracellular solute-binding protein [Reinekea sp. G2M2-21]